MPALVELDAVALASVVARAVGRSDIKVGQWSLRSIHAPFNRSTGGLYRVAGAACAGDQTLAWSVVAKAVGASKDPFGGTTDASDASYWAREPSLFESGALEHLPGLRSPCCFGVDWRSDTSAWIWLEDIAEHVSPRWSLSDFRLAAHRLGQFNGAYLAGRPLPSSTHLSHAWHRSFVGTFAAAFDRLPQLRGHPLVRRCWPGNLLDQVVTLWQERDLLLTALDELPQTFCHLDAFPRNLLINAATREVVAVDWSYAGIAAIGAELAPLIAASACVGDAEADQLPAIDSTACDGYLDGLRAAGWHGESETVRLGYAAAVALHYGLVPLGIYLTDDRLRPRFEQLFSRDATSIADHWATVSVYLFDRADEARTLLRDATTRRRRCDVFHGSAMT